MKKQRILFVETEKLRRKQGKESVVVWEKPLPSLEGLGAREGAPHTREHMPPAPSPGLAEKGP